MKTAFTLFLIVLLAISCKQDQKPKPATVLETPKTVSYDGDLPPLPLEKLGYLLENASYIDYIFHNLPFSMSQNTKEGVQGNISLINHKGYPQYRKGCPSLGREFFHVNGEIVMEAEVYFSPENNCYAYIFYEDKKPVYANGISDAGKKFYQNMIKQASQVANGQQ